MPGDEVEVVISPVAAFNVKLADELNVPPGVVIVGIGFESFTQYVALSYEKVGSSKPTTVIVVETVEGHPPTIELKVII